MSVLRKLFSDDKDEIWKRLGEELSARFEKGDWRRGSSVRADVGQWTVTLDTYTVSTGKTTVTFTRVRAPYVNADGFRFKITRRNFFSGIARALGMQDLEVGVPGFDERFVIRSNDPAKVRSLFAVPRIRELLEVQPHVRLEVRDDEGWFGPKFPEGVDELRFEVQGMIKDLARLKLLFELFSEVLQQLCRMGSAYESDPGVKL